MNERNMKPITEEIWMDYLSGNLSAEEMEAIGQRIEKEPEVAAAWEEIKSTWDLLTQAEPLPEPSTEMDAGFDAMLAQYAAKELKRKPLMEQLQSLLGTWVVPRWAVGALLLIIGFGLGRVLGPSGESEEMVALTQEVQDMRQMMMLTLLEQPRAQDRMRAVSMTQSLPTADEKVIEALAQTLHTDANVNVRLVAVEALAQYSENPVARMGLIESIAKQDSPLVQIALAEVMLKLGDTQSVSAFEELLENPALDTTVQEVVQETISKLI
ncbi:MAG TPA: anti-sigma factor [Cytophagales bacterium]|nr:anti-sigma factor [Cytophagales bacterium]